MDSETKTNRSLIIDPIALPPACSACRKPHERRLGGWISVHQWGKNEVLSVHTVFATDYYGITINVILFCPECCLGTVGSALMTKVPS
jgi:hypothetical protein